MSFRTSQSDRLMLKKLSTSMEAIKSEFGSNKAAIDYSAGIETSMQRYYDNRFHNLFAIVMPGGTGKTWIARKYGLIDVDECVHPSEHELLYHVRKENILKNKSWVNHNDAWVKRVRRTLESLDLSRPTVILCHTEEFAYEIGAHPILAITLEKSEWRRNISSRSALGVMFSEINYEVVNNLTTIAMRVAKTNQDVERLVIKAMNAYNLPIACPQLYECEWNDSYDRGVPDWVLCGDRNKLDVKVLIRLFDNGMVPKECMDYFLKDTTIPASYGFGITMNDWARFFGTCVYYMNEPREIPNGDPGDIWPFSNIKEKTRMNVTLRRLLAVTSIKDDPGTMKIMGAHVGASHNFVTGLVCYWHGLGMQIARGVDVLQLLLVNQAHFKKIMQEFGSYIRVSKYYMNTKMSEGDRHKLTYLEQLLGRRLFEADWETVISERQGNSGLIQHLGYDKETDEWTTERYRSDFKYAIDKGFSRIKSKPRHYDIKSYYEFFKRRGEWLTKGSTVYNEIKPEHRVYVADVLDEVGNKVSEIKSRHNKKSLFEMGEVFSLMGNKYELRNVTRAVEKLNECGYKDRTLLPGSLFHYLVTSYVLEFFTKQEQYGTVRVNAPPDNDIRYMDRKLIIGLDHLLYDWANFNAFHSAEEMGLMIEKMASVVPMASDAGDFAAATVSWFWDMNLIKPDGSLAKLDNGLFSGWKDTAGMNGRLNDAYLTCAELSFNRIYGYDPVLYKDHGGDDVDEALKKPEDTYRMLYIMGKMQFEARAIKQMIGETSEFFRITFTDGVAYGSPVRALAAFINGNWESTGDAPIRERVGAVLDQIAKIKRRGVDHSVCDVLSAAAISHWAKVKTDIDWLELPDVVIHGAIEQGGFGVPDADGNIWTLSGSLKSEIQQLDLQPPGTSVAEATVQLLIDELVIKNLEVIEVDEVVKRLAVQSFSERGDELFDELVKTKVVVVDKNPAVVPKWDDTLFKGFMEYRNSDNTVSRDLAKFERYKMLIGHISNGKKVLDSKDLCKVLELDIIPEISDFKGSSYYRRIVGDEIAELALSFARAGLNYNRLDVDEAHEVFETICYMSSVIFDHRV